MIPKVIHYCWFGRNPLPKSALKSIASWRKYLPNYEIQEWNEDNFDVNIIPFTKEAYQAKKYAFVSDYARYWIIYKYGGIYFDTDVEIIQPIDDIIARGPFMGCENEASQEIGKVLLDVNPGLGFGAYPNIPIFKEIMTRYASMHFVNEYGNLNLITVVKLTTEVFVTHGLENTNKIQECGGIFIYPKSFFSPKDFESGKVHIKKETRCIHHFEASWLTKKEQRNLKIYRFLGTNRNNAIIVRIRSLFSVISTIYKKFF